MPILNTKNQKRLSEMATFLLLRRNENDHICKKEAKR